MADYEAKQFDMETVAKAAGCPFPTLASWRLRGKLFKETVTGTKHSKYFSLTDVCIARAVKMLTDRGISTKDAIDTVDHSSVRVQIVALLSGEKVSSIFGYHLNSKGRDEKRRLDSYFFEPDDFRNMLSKAGGVMITIDLAAVIDHVRNALKIKEP
ncbi:hypothetical protein ACVW1C_008104 [Bradyrhizobium sp. USDA 4011]